jgi:RNA polymerase sigma-70 factor (ECF subfamily)
VVIPAPTAPAPLLDDPADRDEVDDGDAVDIEHLYRLHARTVARWAARLGGPGTDVEDVVQEVFLVANRRLRTFTGDGRVTTWLFRATANVAAAARRKRRLARWFGATTEVEASGMGAAGPSPGDALEQRQQAAQVYRALDALPERMRRVLVLFEMEGLSTPEIAELTGARVATVRVWLFRARAKFQEHYQAAGDDGQGGET